MVHRSGLSESLWSASKNMEQFRQNSKNRVREELSGEYTLETSNSASNLDIPQPPSPKTARMGELPPEDSPWVSDSSSCAGSPILETESACEMRLKIFKNRDPHKVSISSDSSNQSGWGLKATPYFETREQEAKSMLQSFYDESFEDISNPEVHSTRRA